MDQILQLTKCRTNDNRRNHDNYLLRTHNRRDIRKDLVGKCLKNNKHNNLNPTQKNVFSRLSFDISNSSKLIGFLRDLRLSQNSLHGTNNVQVRISERPPTGNYKDGAISFSYLNVEGRLCRRSEWSYVPVNLPPLLPRCNKELSGTLVSKHDPNDIVIGVCVHKKCSTVFHIAKNMIS